MLPQIKDYPMHYLYRKKKWLIPNPILRALSAQWYIPLCSHISQQSWNQISKLNTVSLVFNSLWHSLMNLFIRLVVRYRVFSQNFQVNQDRNQTMNWENWIKSTIATTMDQIKELPGPLQSCQQRPKADSLDRLWEHDKHKVIFFNTSLASNNSLPRCFCTKEIIWLCFIHTFLFVKYLAPIDHSKLLVKLSFMLISMLLF